MGTNCSPARVFAACGASLAACVAASGGVDVDLLVLAQTEVDLPVSSRFIDSGPAALNNRRDYAFAYMEFARRYIRHNGTELSELDAPPPTYGFDMNDDGDLVWIGSSVYWGNHHLFLRSLAGPTMPLAEGTIRHASINDGGFIAYTQSMMPVLREPAGTTIAPIGIPATTLQLNDENDLAMFLFIAPDRLAVWRNGLLDVYDYTCCMTWPSPVDFSYNDSGAMAFMAYGDILAGPPEAVQVVLERPLFAPPGSPPDTLTAIRPITPIITDGGDIVFVGEDLSRSVAVFLMNESGVHRVVGRGDLVETARGTRLIQRVDPTETLAANDRGDILFMAILGDPAIPDVWTDKAVLLAHIRPECAAELTGDAPASVDELDLLAYLDLWFARDPAADVTIEAPARVDVFDLLEYLNGWFTAVGNDGECP